MAFCTRCKEHVRDVNPKNLARLENNDTNNKSALVKHVYSQNHLYKKKIFRVFFFHSNKYALMTKPIVFIQLPI